MVKANKTDKLVFDLRMHQIEYNKQKEESLRREIADKYGVPQKNVDINFIPITVDEHGDTVSLAKDVIDNIQDPRFQVSLFKEYIETKGLENIDFSEIEAIDSQVNALVNFDSYSSYRSYKFKYVKWDNYLSYGSGNHFDFTQLHGLVLLNGQPENQCGKTTFAIDLLRFALFGKSHKSPDLNSVFNIYHPEDTEVVVEACIEIDGCDYVIRRTVTRPPLKKRTEKSKSKQKVEYFKIVNGEYSEIENCEGESGRETNNIIKESVGSVEDYNLIISATSKTLGDLLEMGQTDKGRLFSRWLGLLTIERKEQIAKDMWKTNVSPKLLSNAYNKATIEGEINDMRNVINDDQEKITREEQQMAECEARLKELNERKVSELSKCKEIDANIATLDVTTLENRLGDTSGELETYRMELKRYKDEYMPIKDVVFDQTALDEQTEQRDRITSNIHTIEVENAELKATINSKRGEIGRINALIDEKKCPTCGHEVDTEKQNENIDAIQKEIAKLIETGVANKKRIEKLNEDMAAVNIKIKELEKLRADDQTKRSLELRMVAVKAKIDAAKLTIVDIERQLSEIEKNKEKIRFNNEITTAIKAIDESIRTETGIKEGHIRTIESYRNDIANHNKSIEERKGIIEKLTSEEKTIRHWNLYQQMVGKNGIVKIVLKKALPVINNEVARLLNGLCDFKVEVSVSDDNLVCMDLIRGGQRLDLGKGASGFESVMASIALRHSLACVATLPKPNFTVLDEVLDGVAVSNYGNVRELFRRITTSYDFIIHITHNELLSDWHDMNVCVTKDEDLVSRIELK